MFIEYSEYVFLALVTRYTKHIRGIILSSVDWLTLQYFSTLSHKRYDIRKISHWTQSMCFDLLYKFVWNVSHSKKNWARYDKNVYWSSCKVQYRYSCHILMKFELSRQIFEKYSNMKFHENLSNGNKPFPCGRLDGWTNTDRQSDMTKLTVSFRNFAKAPEECHNIRMSRTCICLRGERDVYNKPVSN